MSAQPARSPTFAEMSRREKFVFVLKVSICIISFGMIFRNIMHD